MSYKVSVLPQHEEGEKLTCCARESMEMPPDTLETVGVNKLFVAVTVDASFTTEQTVVGRIDEIQILSVVRTAPMVGYLSPSHICDDCALLRARKLDMEMTPDSPKKISQSRQ
jgi:hypothetical protein